MDVLQLHDRTVNLTTREVRGPTTTGHLTELEVRLLRYLAERPGQAVSRTTLLVDVWGYAPHVRTRTVAAAFKRLRQKLEAPSGPPRHILTVYGEGYRLEGIGAAHHPSPSEPPASRLLDRDQLLQQLRALVARPGVVVGIVGPPGVGTSSVLATLATASASPSVIDLRVHSPPTSTESLLLLDHLDEHPQARAILANRSPASSTAYTVLRPLHHPGEVVLQVPPLAPNAARELFRHFLQATRPDLHPGPEVVSRLSDALDGLPRALELAAQQARRMSLDALVDRLDHSFRWLRPPGPSVGRALSDGFAQAWHTLTHTERMVAEALAVLDGPCALELAEAVVCSPREPDLWLPEVLAELVDTGLLLPPDASGRYRLLHTFRAWCAARTSPPRRTRILDRLVEHLATLDPRSITAETVAQQQPALVRTALRRVVETKPPGAFSVIVRLAWFLEHEQGSPSTLLQLLPAPDTVDSSDRATLLVVRGAAHLHSGDIDAARADLHHAFRLLVDHPNPILQAEAHRETALALRVVGDLAGARQSIEAARDLARACGNLRFEGLACITLGMVCSNLDAPDDATAALERALRCCQAARDNRRLLSVQTNLAMQYRRAGRLAEAIALYNAILVALTDPGPLSSVRTRLNLSYAHVLAGHPEPALTHARACLSLAQDREQPRVEARAWSALGLALDATGNTDPADAALSRALSIFERLGDHRSIVRHGIHQLDLRLAAGQPDRAQVLAQYLTERLAHVPTPTVRIALQAAVAEVRAHRGAPTEALADLEECTAPLFRSIDFSERARQSCRRVRVHLLQGNVPADVLADFHRETAPLGAQSLLLWGLPPDLLFP
jgi:tetratricopeptide (TPR) repeat protein/DNA-binding winged helix-turn-helix (wHTH) protein